ncbi:MAG: hypothetical protein AAFY00_10335, partial [Bacteroidota bacterium]
AGILSDFSSCSILQFYVKLQDATATKITKNASVKFFFIKVVFVGCKYDGFTSPNPRYINLFSFSMNSLRY